VEDFREKRKPRHLKINVNVLHDLKILKGLNMNSPGFHPGLFMFNPFGIFKRLTS